MKRIFTLIAVFILAYTFSYSQCTPCSIPFVGASLGTGGNTGVVIPKPTGVLQGHLMVAAVHVGWCSGSVITPPPGWTLINQTSNTSSGCGPSNTSIQLATFYKIAGASEPLTYTFSASSLQYYVGGIVAYSGANTVTPIHVASNNGAQDDCSNIVASGVTTTVSCSRLVSVFFCSVNSSANNIIPQASLSERFDVGTSGNNPWGNENLSVSDELLNTPGATGSRTAALVGCGGTGWITGAQLIAINSATTSLAPFISVNSGSICSGNSFTITPSGANTYTVQGGNAVVSPTANTTYTVIGTGSNGCPSNVVSSTVTVNSNPTVSAVSNTSVVCVGQTASLTASGATTYSWSNSATTPVVAVSPTITTTYTVTGTNALGCKKTATVTQNVSSCVGIEELSAVSTDNVIVYPNPSNGVFTIALQANSIITIVDLLGKIVYTKSLQEGKQSINLTILNKGIYTLKADANGVLKTARLIKE